MGFEQLAALKEQLAMQAKKSAPERKQPPKERPAQSARPPRTEPVDPVILSISRLQRRFPKAFPKSPAPKIPLKLGIHKDLFLHSKELDLNETEIRLAIKTWCEGRRYWTCMVEAAARVDLAGAEVGAVTAPEALRAKRLSAGRGSKGHKHRRKPGAAQPAKEAELAGADSAAAPADTESAPAASADATSAPVDAS